MSRGVLITILVVAAIAAFILTRVLFSASNEVVLDPPTAEELQLRQQMMPGMPQPVPMPMPPTQQ